MQRVTCVRGDSSLVSLVRGLIHKYSLSFDSLAILVIHRKSVHRARTLQRAISRGESLRMENRGLISRARIKQNRYRAASALPNDAVGSVANPEIDDRSRDTVRIRAR